MEKTSSGTLTSTVLQASRQDVVDSINDLRDHIIRGCLSDIPPGEGTERNERLHDFLSSSLLGTAKTMSLLYIIRNFRRQYYIVTPNKGQTLHV